MSSELVPFAFGAEVVRTQIVDGGPMFILKDLCRLLGISKSGATLNSMPEEWQGVILNITPHGTTQYTAVNEAGMWRLVMRSRKPEAVAIQNWIAGEVLPALRKNGTYSAPGGGKTFEERIQEAALIAVQTAIAGASAVVDSKIKLAEESAAKKMDTVVKVVETVMKEVSSRVDKIEDERSHEITLSDWSKAEGIFIKQRELAQKYFPGANKNPIVDMCRAAGARTEKVKVITDNGTYENIEVLVCDGLDEIVEDVRDSITFDKETPGCYCFASPLLMHQKHFRINKLAFHGEVRATWEPILRRAGLKIVKKLVPENT